MSRSTLVASVRDPTLEEILCDSITKASTIGHQISMFRRYSFRRVTIGRRWRMEVVRA
jgi:hypothetical protein